MCRCPDGFKPKSPKNWDLMDWSGGCVRNNTPSCNHKDKDDFVNFYSLKLPDTSRSWLAEKLNEEECRAMCLNNCSCVAYTTHDLEGRGGDCVIWYGDLIDVRQISESGEDLFIRIPY